MENANDNLSGDGVGSCADGDQQVLGDYERADSESSASSACTIPDPTTRASLDALLSDNGRSGDKPRKDEDGMWASTRLQCVLDEIPIDDDPRGHFSRPSSRAAGTSRPSSVTGHRPASRRGDAGELDGPDYQSRPGSTCSNYSRATEGTTFGGRATFSRPTSAFGGHLDMGPLDEENAVVTFGHVTAGCLMQGRKAGRGRNSSGRETPEGKREWIARLLNPPDMFSGDLADHAGDGLGDLLSAEGTLALDVPMYNMQQMPSRPRGPHDGASTGSPQLAGVALGSLGGQVPSSQQDLQSGVGQQGQQTRPIPPTGGPPQWSRSAVPRIGNVSSMNRAQGASPPPEHGSSPQLIVTSQEANDNAMMWETELSDGERDRRTRLNGRRGSRDDARDGDGDGGGQAAASSAGRGQACAAAALRSTSAESSDSSSSTDGSESKANVCHSGTLKMSGQDAGDRSQRTVVPVAPPPREARPSMPSVLSEVPTLSTIRKPPPPGPRPNAIGRPGPPPLLEPMQDRPGRSANSHHHDRPGGAGSPTDDRVETNFHKQLTAAIAKKESIPGAAIVACGGSRPASSSGMWTTGRPSPPPLLEPMLDRPITAPDDFAGSNRQREKALAKMDTHADGNIPRSRTVEEIMNGLEAVEGGSGIPRRARTLEEVVLPMSARNLIGNAGERGDIAERSEPVRPRTRTRSGAGIDVPGTLDLAALRSAIQQDAHLSPQRSSAAPAGGSFSARGNFAGAEPAQRRPGVLMPLDMPPMADLAHGRGWGTTGMLADDSNHHGVRADHSVRHGSVPQHAMTEVIPNDMNLQAELRRAVKKSGNIVPRVSTDVTVAQARLRANAIEASAPAGLAQRPRTPGSDVVQPRLPQGARGSSHCRRAYSGAAMRATTKSPELESPGGEEHAMELR